MIRTRSIAVRLAIMFGLATALVSLIASAGLFMQQSAEFRRHSLQELRGRYVIVERMAAYNEDQAGWQRLTAKLRDFSATDRGLRFVTDSADSRFRFGPSLLAQATFARVKDGHDTAEFDGRTYATYAGTILAKGDRPDARLIIGMDQRPLYEARKALGLGIVGTSLLTILGVSALGWWIAREGLRPADRLSSHAQRLGAGDPALRLPVDGLPAEMEGLVLSFNDALGRLHESHRKLSDFNADVAHELRTPLTNLIGETELALARERSHGELAQVLRSNLEELDRLRLIINDMLFLARSDAGDLASNLSLVDLAEECRRTVEFMDVLFEESGVAVSIEGHARCWVERALFGRALANLLDNAIRHGTPKGRITVRVASADDRTRVFVTNEARPIPDGALPRIFDRFYCADPSRRASGHSHGLGLSIVQAIARMHGGEVSAASGDGEVTIGFELPSGLGNRRGAVRDRSAATEVRNIPAERTGPTEERRKAMRLPGPQPSDAVS